MIAEADIAAGQLIGEAGIDAWIDSIGTGHESPPPLSAAADPTATCRVS